MRLHYVCLFPHAISKQKIFYSWKKALRMSQFYFILFFYHNKKKDSIFVYYSQRNFSYYSNYFDRISIIINIFKNILPTKWWMLNKSSMDNKIQKCNMILEIQKLFSLSNEHYSIVFFPFTALEWKGCIFFLSSIELWSNLLLYKKYSWNYSWTCSNWYITSNIVVLRSFLRTQIHFYMNRIDSVLKRNIIYCETLE